MIDLIICISATSPAARPLVKDHKSAFSNQAGKNNLKYFFLAKWNIGINRPSE
jgi:hypothetical protein